jgi:hypothetical protein
MFLVYAGIGIARFVTSHAHTVLDLPLAVFFLAAAVT